MKTWLFGLIALVLSVNLAVAQGLSQALPSEYSVSDIMLKVAVPASGGTAVSAAIPDPSELVSLDYDAGSVVGLSGLSVTVAYSDNDEGPFIAGTGAAATQGLASITWSNTPTSGADFKAYPAKWAQFTFHNAGTVAIPSLRLSALRRTVGHVYRPVELVDQAINNADDSGYFGLDGLTLLTGASTALLPASPASPVVNPGEIIGVEWITTGSVGTRDLDFFYSNAKAGPFVAWESQATESPAYVNSVTATPIAAQVFAKPFQARFALVKFHQASGATTVLTHVTATRRTQLRR